MSKSIQPSHYEPNSSNSFCWQILATDQSDFDRLRRDIDVLFDRFSYHPEVEWLEFGYAPPQGYEVLDAWKDPDTITSVFLLRRPTQRKEIKQFQLILCAVGQPSMLHSIDKKVNTLKKGHSRRIVKTSETLGAVLRLDQMNHTRSIAFFSGYIAFVTALVNAFSHYLRTLNPPSFDSTTLQYLYIALLDLIYFSSAGLLSIVTIVCDLFLIKYSYILLKRV